MRIERLPPTLERTDRSGHRTQPAWVTRQFPKAPPRRLEHQVHEEVPVVVPQRIQLMRNREDHMVISTRQRLLLSFPHPALRLHPPALGTTTVLARVVAQLLNMPVRTPDHVETLLRRVARLNVEPGPPLPPTQRPGRSVGPEMIFKDPLDDALHASLFRHGRGASSSKRSVFSNPQSRTISAYRASPRTAFSCRADLSRL